MGEMMNDLSPAQNVGSVWSVVSPYLGVAGAALGVSLLATPLMRRLALRYGVVDRPDLVRKRQRRPVAYLGGAAIFLAWLAGLATCHFITPHDPRAADLGLTHVSFPISLVIGALVITLTGLFDDVFGLSPRVKIGGQLFAAAALAHNDVGTELVKDFIIALGYPAQPPPPELLCYVIGAALIAVFVLGGCNSLNLLDGMDGLAGGVTLIAAVGLLFLAVFAAVGLTGPAHGPPGIDILTSPLRIAMCMALIGAVLGFLPYNYHPASIYLGDAGSLLLGYLTVGSILLLAHAPAAGPALVMAGLIIFALPIIDTLLAIVRRKVAGKRISEPDHHHLHHKLLARGFGVRRATLTLYALAACFAVSGCTVVFLRGRYVLLVFVGLFSTVPIAGYIMSRRARRGAPVNARDNTPGRQVSTHTPV